MSQCRPQQGILRREEAEPPAEKGIRRQVTRDTAVSSVNWPHCPAGQPGLQHAVKCLLHAHCRALPVFRLYKKCCWGPLGIFLLALKISAPFAGFRCVVDHCPTPANFRNLVGCTDVLILLPSRNSCSSQEMWSSDFFFFFFIS